VALRLAARSPCDYRRLALRLQRQQTPLRPRRTHPNRVRPTVDHDPPTPSRIATGPPNGSPSTSLTTRAAVSETVSMLMVAPRGFASLIRRSVPNVRAERCGNLRVGIGRCVASRPAPPPWDLLWLPQRMLGEGRCARLCNSGSISRRQRRLLGLAGSWRIEPPSPPATWTIEAYTIGDLVSVRPYRG